MMTFANLLFVAGLVGFLTGLALIDYRLSLIVGGALAMAIAWRIAAVVSPGNAGADRNPDSRSRR